MGLRARPRCLVQFEEDKVQRLRCLYLRDRFNINESELDKDYSTLNFESDDNAMKMSLFYFIKLAMMERERRLYMDWTMLGLINDLEDFVSYN
ncbi:hypothetical protein E5676_scaffold177G00900 [Cucumis melo var. makuwa]|uniref:Ulp1-like peptidase n=2 Tax=Cucumis melo TaxID=3656 RepID=A0A5D3CKT3_CUCMM|nr:hypothetical protein E5676_scaffold177G00900 [Cucumis melo var. makuwa]